MMKFNQYAIYRVNKTAEGRKLWRHSMEYVKKRKIPVIIENYHQIYLNQFDPIKVLYDIYNGAQVAYAEAKKGDVIEVSDVLVLNRAGEISCFYVDEDKEKLIRLPNFIRMNTDGALISVDTEHFKIDNQQGQWRVVDSIIYLGNQFYLMENEKYGKSVTSVVLDAYGKIVVDQVTKFDEAVKDKIRQYMDNRKPLTQQQTSLKNRFLHYQESFENGKYPRAKESGTEQNYDMVDGTVNNEKPSEKKEQKNSKKKKEKKRTSVILRLRKKQKLVAEKSGRPVPEYLQDLEYNRK